jgi:hypothetical protein
MGRRISYAREQFRKRGPVTWFDTSKNHSNVLVKIPSPTGFFKKEKEKKKEKMRDIYYSDSWK